MNSKYSIHLRNIVICGLLWSFCWTLTPVNLGTLPAWFSWNPLNPGNTLVKPWAYQLPSDFMDAFHIPIWQENTSHTHTRHIFKTPIRTAMNFSSMRAFHLNLSIEYNSSDLPKELVFFAEIPVQKKSTSWIPVAWWRHLPRNWRLTCLGTKSQSWGKVESMVERQVDYRVSGGIN